MKAIILAAGRGSRLWPLTAARPKCLLRLGVDPGTETILEHQLNNLESAGIRSAVLVCGFGVDKVRHTIRQLATGVGVKILYNPFFSVSDNLISLWAARSEMNEDFLLLNGDNVFEPGILTPLLTTSDPICLAVDRRATYNADHMKLQIVDDSVVKIGKHLPLASVDAASIGIMRFSGSGVDNLREILEQAVSDDRALSRHFPDAIQRLIDHGYRVSYRQTQLTWTDVDTPDDLQAARGLQSRRFGAEIETTPTPPSRPTVSAPPMTAIAAPKETA